MTSYLQLKAPSTKKDLSYCSVIIPSFHSSQTIGACLEALLRQDFKLPYEIIVVDSSFDNTPEIIRRSFPQVRLVHLAQQTEPGLARNIGVYHASGDMLAFIDADCIARPDWLKGLYSSLLEGYDGVGGAIANANSDRLASWASYFCEFREFLPQGQPRDVSNLTLGNVAYRRDSFQALRGFPVNFFPQEDQVFHDLAHKQGYQIRFDPQIVVSHNHRAETRAFLKHQYFIGQSNARVLKILDKPGANLARHPWLALLVLPLLVILRFWRTFKACCGVEHAVMVRRPALIWLCWLGMWGWGFGFVRGTLAIQPELAGTTSPSFSLE